MAKTTKKEIPKTKNPVGRPSQLEETLVKAREYLLEGKWQELGDVIPSVAGLACYSAKGRNNIYEYAKQSIEFKNILEGITALQENILLNNGLKGTFNATIAKLVMGKHGYHERMEVDNSSTDGSMVTRAPSYKIISK